MLQKATNQTTDMQDDMQLAPDFFSYFAAMANLMDQYPSLWCISSWNDHGSARLVSDPTQLYRSDFFPGLGWMLTYDVWQDLKYALHSPDPQCPRPAHVTYDHIRSFSKMTKDVAPCAID